MFGQSSTPTFMVGSEVTFDFSPRPHRKFVILGTKIFHKVMDGEKGVIEKILQNGMYSIRMEKDQQVVTIIGATRNDFAPKQILTENQRKSSSSETAPCRFSFGFPFCTLPENDFSESESERRPSAKLLVGKERYKILKKLDEGSFGEVFKICLASDVEYTYALKKFKYVDPRQQQAALTEASILNRLEHENIIRYVDAFLSQGLLYLVMELATGGDLSKTISTKKLTREHWSAAFIKSCFVQILSGIAFLHRSNVMHRDLKPGNLLLKDKVQEEEDVPIIKIADFGLSKVMGGSHGTAAQAQTRCGTPLYMSPEALDSQDGSGYSYKNDVWALGCILYELCMLTRPFKAQSKIYVGDIPKIDEKSSNGEDWQELRNLCAWILVRDVNERPSSSMLSGILNVKPEGSFVDNSWVNGKEKVNFSLLKSSNYSCGSTKALPVKPQIPQTVSSQDVSSSKLQVGHVIRVNGHRVPEMNDLLGTIQSNVSKDQWTIKLHEGEGINELFAKNTHMKDMINVMDLVTVLQTKNLVFVKDRQTAEKDRREEEKRQKEEQQQMHKKKEPQQKIETKRAMEVTTTNPKTRQQLDDRVQEVREAYRSIPKSARVSETTQESDGGVFAALCSLVTTEKQEPGIIKPGTGSARRDYNHLFKMCIIGDSGVGKSCVLLRFADDAFTNSYISTIGVDFRFRTVRLFNNITTKLQIWDLAGQERFRTVTSAYYRGADAFIMVYDVNKRETFEHLDDWLREINRYRNDNISRFLTVVGNKCDKKGERKISKEEGLAYAKKIEAQYFETSSKSGDNVEEVFLDYARDAVRHAVTKEFPAILESPKQIMSSSDLARIISTSTREYFSDRIFSEVVSIRNEIEVEAGATQGTLENFWASFRGYGLTKKQQEHLDSEVESGTRQQHESSSSN